MNLDNKQQSLLTFRVGPVLCCAPSLPVKSIITPPKLTQIAGCDPSTPGIFKHGSDIVKALDLRQKFGVEESQQTQPGNMVVTNCEKENYAFWVDQILDVFDFPSEGWSNLPAAIPRGVFTHTLLLNNKIHLYSEFEKLATINNLGYLKQYILQLTAEDKKPTSSETAEVTKSPDSTKTKESKAEIKPHIKTHIDELKSISAVTDTSFQTTNKTQEPISTPALSQSTLVQKPAITSSVKAQNKTTAKKEIKKVSTPRESNKPVQAVTKTGLQQQTLSKTKSHLPPKEENTFSLKTQAAIKHYDDVDDEISYFAIFLFFIVILGVLATGLYYLLNDDFSNESKVKKEIKINNTELNYYSPKTKTVAKDSEPEPELLLIPEESTVSSQVKIINETEINIPEITNNPVEPKEYRAEITKDDNEITITIHQPVTEEVIVQPVEVIKAQEIEDEVKNEKIVETPAVKTLQENELNKAVATKKIIHEVMHTVVKGDTLWAIAKKYVNDPFLYPELARLSNIKNPHRIYPGNRVRIRFIKN